MRARPLARSVIPFAFAAALLLVAACGGSPSARARAANAACGAAGPNLVRIAVLEYIRVSSPTPQRFLTAASTDSALPGPGVTALQDRGPTFFYLPDPAKQKQVRDRLATLGDFTSLLIVYHGMETDSTGAPLVRLGGHYIGGQYEGLAAAPRTIRFACDSSARWKVASSATAEGTR